MFWTSVIEGLRLLRHPEIWIGALGVIGVFFLLLFGVAQLAKVARAGCAAWLGIMLGVVLLPSILTACFYAFLLPIILGGGSITSPDVVGAHVGTIEPGKLADMIMVQGNPLEDIANARRVRRVIANGRVIEPSATEKVAPLTARMPPKCL